MLMSQNQQYCNLGFDRNEIYVYCIGVGGATVHLGGNCITLFGKGFAPAPSVMYVHVGENNIFTIPVIFVGLLTLLGLFSLFHPVHRLLSI